MPASVSTPIQELRQRANAVRAPLSPSSLLQAPLDDGNLTGRERDVALEAERDFEPTIKDLSLAISAMSKNIVVRDDIRAEVAEALQPVTERLLDVEEGMSKLGAQSSNLHMREAAIESGAAAANKRVSELERGHISERIEEAFCFSECEQILMFTRIPRR